MTSNDPIEDNDASADCDQERCMLYLLGELDQESNRAFEEHLAANPDLAAVLLDQADLILNLSSISTSVDDSVPAQPSPTSHRSATPLLRWIAVAASIAACVALAFQIRSFAPIEIQGESPSSEVANAGTAGSNEQLLIARAWASSHYPIVDNELDLREADPDAAYSDSKIDEVEYVDRSDDIDSAVSWMFVAISSSPEMQTDGDNDG